MNKERKSIWVFPDAFFVPFILVYEKVNEDGEGTECITCADIPNITNYDVEE